MTAKSKTFKYDRNNLATSIANIIKKTINEQITEELSREINIIVDNLIIEPEERYIKSLEKQEKHPTIKELSYSLIGRNIDAFTHIYKTEETPKFIGWEETEESRLIKKHEDLMNRLYRAAFQAYMELDFVDITEMLNYRKAEFTEVGPIDKKEESLEATYIINKPGEYEVKEIQEYVYWVVQEALHRYLDDLNAGMLEEDPQHMMGEYCNHSSGIFCRVTEDGVEINYVPIYGYGDADFIK